MRRLLAAMAVLAVIGTAVWLLLPREREPEGGAVRTLRAGAELELSGPLSLQMASALRRAAGAMTVQLDSPGGSRAGAETVAAAIRAAGQDTAVTDRCLGACVVAFMAGRRRWVGPFAQFGLDAASVPLYRRAGVPDDFVREAAATPPGQAWYPTAAEMVTAGLATAIAAPDQFALGGFGPAPTPDSIRARMLAVPLYRALSQADPQGFDAVAAFWTATVMDGQPGTEAFDRMRSLLARTFAAALPFAGDPLVLTHAALFRDELAWMLAHDPAHCAGWAAAQGGLPGPIDDDLVRRRRELEGAVLTGAGPQRASKTPRQASCAELAARWADAASADEVRALLRSP